MIVDHSISQESLREQVRLYIYVSEDIYIWREKHYIVTVKKSLKETMPTNALYYTALPMLLWVILQNLCHCNFRRRRSLRILTPTYLCCPTLFICCCCSVSDGIPFRRQAVTLRRAFSFFFPPVLFESNRSIFYLETWFRAVKQKVSYMFWRNVL